MTVLGYLGMLLVPVTFPVSVVLMFAGHQAGKLGTFLFDWSTFMAERWRNKQ